MTAAPLFYLATPVLLFWWAYVGGAVGTLLGAGVVLALGLVLAPGLLPARAGAGAGRRSAALAAPGSRAARRAIWAGAMLLALAVLWLTGFPAGPFPSDWFKHWALIGALAERPWPVHVTLQGQDYGLRFYIAAYLVPAALAKAPLGWPLWLGTAAWLGLGYALVFRAVASCGKPVQTAGRALATMILFLLMAGADSLVECSLRALAGLPQAPWLGFHHEWWALDWLAQPLQYSAVLTSLSWVPHQSIATFLVALMLCDEREPAPWAGALAMGLLALWSPLGMIGLLPLLLWRLAKTSGHGRHSVRGRLGALGLALVLLALVLATARYLASELPSTGLTWPTLAKLAERVPAGLLFGGVELLPFLLMLGLRRCREPLVTLSLGILLVLPWLGGETPDFVMRASLGPLAVLAWRSAQVLADPRAAVSDTMQRTAGERCGRPLAWLGLTIASLTSVNEAVYQRQGGAAHAQQPDGDALRKDYLLTFAHGSDYSVPAFFEISGWRFLPQYFARHPAWVNDKGSDAAD